MKLFKASVIIIGIFSRPGRMEMFKKILSFSLFVTQALQPSPQVQKLSLTPYINQTG